MKKKIWPVFIYIHLYNTGKIHLNVKNLKSWTFVYKFMISLIIVNWSNKIYSFKAHLWFISYLHHKTSPVLWILFSVFSNDKLSHSLFMFSCMILCLFYYILFFCDRYIYNYLPFHLLLLQYFIYLNSIHITGHVTWKNCISNNNYNTPSHS